MLYSIRSKLILSYILIVIISLGFTVLYFQWSMKSILEQELIKQLKIQSETYSGFIHSRMSGPDDFSIRAESVVSEFVENRRNTLNVYDLSGNLVASSNPTQTNITLPKEKSSEILKGKTIYWYENTDGRRILHVASPVTLVSLSDNQYVGITDLQAPLDQLDSTYLRLKNQLLMAIAISVILTLLVSIVLSKKITNPISLIAQIARRFAGGDYSVRVFYTGRDEIRGLSDTINEMAERIESNIYEILGEKNKMNALLSAMPEGVIALSASGEILFLNEAASRFTGISIENNEKCSLFKSWSIPEVEEFFREREGKNTVITREISVPPYVFKLYLVPFGEDHDSVAGTMMIIRDITDLRRLEETRTRFLGAISHELRTPLTIIKGYIHTIIDEDEIQKSEFIKKALNTMDEETDRLTRLVNELLELSRLRSKKLSFDMQTVKIEQLVEETCQQMKNNAARMNIELTYDKPDTETEITADKDRIKQVVINLIDNAIKYTPSGGNVRIATGMAGKNWFFEVKDNGMGIAKEDLPFLFERFFRTEDKKKKKLVSGTGLGMAIVKEIIDGHNGEIKVKSEEGKGTEITVLLPANY
ncbi:MAG: cell wall metabolism sensor histidine kinase WalK [Firmicutes bacterium]|nr:cell wall metabolism sensor histidine kinase WalK [Bacillota bacterium]